MNEDELRQTLEKRGYKVKITKFKNHDRVTVTTKDFTVRVTLRKHLEETPRESLLKSLLIPDFELANNGHVS